MPLFAYMQFMNCCLPLLDGTSSLKMKWYKRMGLFKCVRMQHADDIDVNNGKQLQQRRKSATEQEDAESTSTTMTALSSLQQGLFSSLPRSHSDRKTAAEMSLPAKSGNTAVVLEQGCMRQLTENLIYHSHSALPGVHFVVENLNENEEADSCGRLIIHQGNISYESFPASGPVSATLQRRRVCSVWKILCIRRFGYNSCSFTFECGRSGPSGEGKCTRSLSGPGSNASKSIYSFKALDDDPANIHNVVEAEMNKIQNGAHFDMTPPYTPRASLPVNLWQSFHSPQNQIRIAPVCQNNQQSLPVSPRTAVASTHSGYSYDTPLPGAHCQPLRSLPTPLKGNPIYETHQAVSLNSYRNCTGSGSEGFRHPQPYVELADAHQYASVYGSVAGGQRQQLDSLQPACSTPVAAHYSELDADRTTGVQTIRQHRRQMVPMPCQPPPSELCHGHAGLPTNCSHV